MLFTVLIVVLILSILVVSHHKESFNINIDDVLDNKCTELNTDLNNYIGPWDGGRGTCGKYTCPKETCFFLEIDKTLSPKYNNSGYKWSSETTSQEMQEVDNNRTCVSKSSTTHPEHNTPLICDTEKQNAPDHNTIDFCYTYDENSMSWTKDKYIKLLDRNGVYQWRKLTDLNDTISEQNIKTCRKEPVNCSASNYYCCEQPGHPDPCLNRHKTIKDKVIEYVPTGADGTECITYDTCTATSCFTGTNTDPLFKNCWQFNNTTRKWNNNRYQKEFRDGICAYFDNNDMKLSVDNLDDLYTKEICKSEKPEYTQEACALENAPIDCGFLDDNENFYTKTYFSRLNYKGDGCRYETDTGHDILLDNLYQSKLYSFNYPYFLPNNDLCPPLSPQQCKDSENFLEIIPNSPPECRSCPEQSYRNDNMFAVSEGTACTPLPDCSKDYCDGDNCCFKRINSDKLEQTKLNMIPQRSNCVPDDDSICEKNEDGTYYECPFNKTIRSGNKIFCDNCPKDYDLEIKGDTLECSRVYECPYSRQKCLNSENTHFFTYYHENDTDKFSPCIWKNFEEPSDTVNVCRTECDNNKYRVNEYCDTLFS